VFVRDRDPDKNGVFDEPGASATFLVSIKRDPATGEFVAAGFSGGPAAAPFLGPTGPERPVISGDGSTITCSTSVRRSPTRRRLWALSRGFLVAGARRVVASNWVVDDQAGATLISYFASYLAKAGASGSGRDYATSLHNAKLLVRKEAKWRSPFYWSSLVLVGPK
jgi:hypothetical protein